MKNYQQLKVLVSFFENDVITTSSQYDNVGGIPDGWLINDDSEQFIGGN